MDIKKTVFFFCPIAILLFFSCDKDYENYKLHEKIWESKYYQHSKYLLEYDLEYFLLKYASNHHTQPPLDSIKKEIDRISEQLLLISKAYAQQLHKNDTLLKAAEERFKCYVKREYGPIYDQLILPKIQLDQQDIEEAYRNNRIYRLKFLASENTTLIDSIASHISNQKDFLNRYQQSSVTGIKPGRTYINWYNTTYHEWRRPVFSASPGDIIGPFEAYLGDYFPSNYLVLVDSVFSFEVNDSVELERYVRGFKRDSIYKQTLVNMIESSNYRIHEDIFSDLYNAIEDQNKRAIFNRTMVDDISDSVLFEFYLNDLKKHMSVHDFNIYFQNVFLRHHINEPRDLRKYIVDQIIAESFMLKCRENNLHKHFQFRELKTYFTNKILMHSYLDQFSSQIQPDEEMIINYYSNHLEDFTLLTSAEFDIISFTNRNEAYSFLKSYQQGELLYADLASTFDLVHNREISINNMSIGRENLERLLQLQKKQASPPLKQDKKFLVYIKKKDLDTEVQPLEIARNGIVQILKTSAEEKLRKELINNAKDNIKFTHVIDPAYYTQFTAEALKDKNKFW